MYEHIIRRATLSGGVTLLGTTWLAYSGRNTFHLEYRGTIDALLAAGCITPSLLAKRMANRRTSQFDEHGNAVWLQRSATKGAPKRMELVRRAEDPETAKQLPGVREMFPEYMQEAAQAEPAPIRLRPVLRIVVNNEFAGGCTA